MKPGPLAVRRRRASTGALARNAGLPNRGADDSFARKERRRFGRALARLQLSRSDYLIGKTSIDGSDFCEQTENFASILKDLV